MPTRTTAAQPVLSQKVERQPVSTQRYLASLYAWCIRRIARQEWVPVDEREGSTALSPFEAVKHEHRTTSLPVVAKESDAVLRPTAKTSAGQRIHPTRSTLLSFKKPGR
jgi:hypothetical protein